MKKFLSLLVIATALYSCANNDASGRMSTEDSLKNARMMAIANDSTQFTTIEWLDSTTQNIGKIQSGSVAEVTWRFKNTGDKPLIIVAVNPSCGCTVADRPKEPIAPGAEGVIKAKFDSKGRPEGAQEKTVSVQANTKNSNTGQNTMHQLMFRGEIVK